MLNSDRARAAAEALFKTTDEIAGEAIESPTEDTPERRRRRIVRRRPAGRAAEPEAVAAKPVEEAEEPRSARELLRLLTRKEAPRIEEPEPVPVVAPAPKRRVVARPPVASQVFQLELELQDDAGQVETLVLVIRGADMADALRATHARVEDWMDERHPGAEWRMAAIELLPDLLV